MKERKDIELNGVANAILKLDAGCSSEEVKTTLLEFCEYVRSDYKYWHEFKMGRKKSE